METETGKVKWFDVKKGFGFITPDISGRDCFVHHTCIVGKGYKRKSLVEGEQVTFEKIDGKDGPKAINVTRK